jgi:NADPH-dependent 2,4-dienoyl-CoA reductase/sulfur reductase-like enzyme
VTAAFGSTPEPARGARPITMFGPDFPFAYDDYLRHPSGLGRVPAERHGTEVAIVGAGIAGLVTAYELMKLGLKPVVYEASRIGGRLRSQRFGSDSRPGRSRIRSPR